MKLRIAAAIGVVVILIGFCALLVGPYWRNWKLQTFVEDLTYDPGSANRPLEALAASVVDRATRLGVPVQPDQVKVTRTDGQLYVEARYIVRVDLGVYTVDLHFRPSAGVR